MIVVLRLHGAELVGASGRAEQVLRRRGGGGGGGGAEEEPRSRGAYQDESPSHSALLPVHVAHTDYRPA